jgi:curved DNA-binding protein CbpA
MEPIALSPTLYEVLGVSESVTVEEVRRLRRALARRYHPDVAAAPDPARLSAILEACEILGEPRRRAGYDARLAGARGSARAGFRRPVSPSFAGARRGPRPTSRARPRFPWQTVRLQALAYGLGAATIPGYATAYWIGSDLSPRAAQTSPNVVLLDGPILAVLAIQAALAVALVVLVHTVRYRSVVRHIG